MTSPDNEPAQSFFRVTKSEIDDFFRAGQSLPLHLGSKTLKLAGAPENRESGIIFGGQSSARCAMTEEDNPQAFTAQVVATVPSTIRGWLQAHTSAESEPTGYVFLETWEAPSPVLELVQ
jgi:hypothetical protein